MKNVSIKILFTIIIIGCSTVYAGWFECYNFSGSIDKYPIVLSIQVLPGYFGETNKKDFNIIGVYKYNNHNNPIKLEGKIDFNSSEALLFEVNNDRYTACFKFKFSETDFDGTWKDINTKKILPFHLRYISKIIDTLDVNDYSNVEILQQSALKDMYFVGVYSKRPGSHRAQMDKLKILNKKDNTVFQLIDFSSLESRVGNFKTIIYENVEVSDIMKKELMVGADVGRIGGYFIISFNPTTKKFKLNHKPLLEGGDPPDIN